MLGLSLCDKKTSSWPKLEVLVANLEGLTSGDIACTVTVGDVPRFDNFLVTLRIPAENVFPLFLPLKAGLGGLA